MKGRLNGPSGKVHRRGFNQLHGLFPGLPELQPQVQAGHSGTSWAMCAAEPQSRWQNGSAIWQNAWQKSFYHDQAWATASVQ